MYSLVNYLFSFVCVCLFVFRGFVDLSLFVSLGMYLFSSVRYGFVYLCSSLVR